VGKKLSRKEKRRLARAEKERKLNSTSLVKNARRHFILGFSIVFILLSAVSTYSSLNQPVPTGRYFKGVVIDLAASSARRKTEVLAAVELENGKIIYLPFKGRYLGEVLEFVEYKHGIPEKFSYQLNR
jgi:hypothetical protein